MTDRPKITRLLTDKTDVGKTQRREDAHAVDVAEGEVLLKVERFALSTNNITYAAFGDAMGYWGFFPTGDAAYGHMPVWGYGRVIESRASGIELGEQFFGYFPIATHLKVQPKRINERGFIDGMENRQSLPVAYNQYARVRNDAALSEGKEDLQMLFRPLYFTSYLLADYLADSSHFGAQRLLLSSASSKTAYGSAFFLKEFGDTPLIGLTSASNKAFVEALGCYDEVRTYDEVESIDSGVAPITYVDFSGAEDLRRRVHLHFGDALVHDCYAGSTASHQLLGETSLPGPKPTMHVAFDQIRKRNADWGPVEAARRIADAQRRFIRHVEQADPPWVRIEAARGFGGAAELVAHLVHGRIDPAVGHVVYLDV